MDTSKLLNVLKDVSVEEENLKINIKLDELFNFIKQNNAGQSDIKKSEIYELLENSILNEYTKSNLSIIKKIKGGDYLGLGAKNFLENIFSSENFKLVPRFEEYRKNRSNFIQNVKNLIKGLEDFEFEPHYQEELYEIGLILPNDYKELDKLYKALNDWDKFLKIVSEILGEESKNEITLVNSGSWEFFVLKTAIVAKTLDIIFNKIADLYLKIQKIQKNSEELKFLKNKTIESELIAEEKKIYNSFVEDVLNETLKKYKGEDGRKNELKNGLKSDLKKILKLTNYGASVEIIIPELIEPEDLEENEEDKEKIKEHTKIKDIYQSKLEERKSFQITNKKILGIETNINKPLLRSGLLGDDEKGG